MKAVNATRLFVLQPAATTVGVGSGHLGLVVGCGLSPDPTLDTPAGLRAVGSVTERAQQPVFSGMSRRPRGPSSQSLLSAELHRCIIHIDVDAFYVEAELLRRASTPCDLPRTRRTCGTLLPCTCDTLHGKSVVVLQNNNGGFVAVSYEAKAAGVRKGDGVGAGGRANIERLQERLSEEGAKKRCRKNEGGELKILPMDKAYYRRVEFWMNAALEKSKVQLGSHRPPVPQVVFQSPTPATGVALQLVSPRTPYGTRRCSTLAGSARASCPARVLSYSLHPLHPLHSLHSLSHSLTPLLHSRSFSRSLSHSLTSPHTHHPQFASRWVLCWKRGAVTTTTSTPLPT